MGGGVQAEGCPLSGSSCTQATGCPGRTAAHGHWILSPTVLTPQSRHLGDAPPSCTGARPPAPAACPWLPSPHAGAGGWTQPGRNLGMGTAPGAKGQPAQRVQHHPNPDSLLVPAPRAPRRGPGTSQAFRASRALSLAGAEVAPPQHWGPSCLCPPCTSLLLPPKRVWSLEGSEDPGKEPPGAPAPSPRLSKEGLRRSPAGPRGQVSPSAGRGCAGPSVYADGFLGTLWRPGPHPPYGLTPALPTSGQ